MLESPQKHVGFAQFSYRLSGYQAALLQGLQRTKCGRRSQFRIATAKDQLLGLDEEFDFANTAATKLDIVAGNRKLFMPGMGVNLPLDRMNVLDGSIVEMPSPDEWLDVL